MDGRQPIVRMSGSDTVHAVEVTTRDMEGLPAARGDSVATMLAADYEIGRASCRERV